MPVAEQTICLARAVYRSSLRLLPRGFYLEYAEQMALDFDDLLRDSASQRGFALLAMTSLRGLADVLLAAVRERLPGRHGALELSHVTPRANAAIAAAASCQDNSGALSADARLLIGLSSESNGLAGVVLREFGVNPARLSEACSTWASDNDSTAAVVPRGIDPAAAFRRQLTTAANWARTFGHDFIGTEHLALSILGHTDGDVARLTERLGVNPVLLREELLERTRQMIVVRPRRLPLLLKAITAILLFAVVAWLIVAVLLSAGA
jgi:hypothetical protein